MLYEILFVAGLFLTRIVLPVALMLIAGEKLARRFDSKNAKS